MIVCHCAVVSDREVREAIDAGAGTLAEVCRTTTAGTTCGRCVATVKALLCQHCPLAHASIEEPVGATV